MINVNLTDVIEGLVDERGLDRESVIDIVCEGVLAAYRKKYPDLDFVVSYDKKSGEPSIKIKKEVVSVVSDEDFEITTRRARALTGEQVSAGDVVEVPFEEGIGRVEVLVAKQIIAGKIRELEYSAVADEFKDKEGTIVRGTVHKKERSGFAVKIGETLGFLPNQNAIPGEVFKVGFPLRALLQEVLATPRYDYQLVLDRASTDFVQKLLEIEIPEVFEGLVEIRKMSRIPGYKTKILVASTSSDIDPVGTCVGVEGVRIKPILRELGGEKVDLIEWSDSLETLVKNALKPAEIDKVEISAAHVATIWLAQDQRSLAIGKMGRNIALASRLTGIEIKLQEVADAAGERPDVSSMLQMEQDED